MAEVDGVMPDLEEAVRSRYAKGAYTAEQNLCCPATYNPELLAAIPDEVLERDYGCGDPTHHLHPGETVLDLSGKGMFSRVPSGRAFRAGPRRGYE